MLTTDRVMEPLTARSQNKLAHQSQIRRDHTYGLRDIIDIVQRYRMFVGILLLVCSVATILTAVFYPKTYTASSAIVFDRNDARPYEAVVELRKQERDRSVMETELDVIKSRVFAGTVVDALGLIDDPDYNTYLPPVQIENESIIGSFFTNLMISVGDGTGNGPELLRKRLISQSVQRNRAISALLTSYTADRRAESLAMTIRVKQNNPVKAATIADAIAEHYVDWTAKLTDEATKTTIAYLRSEAARSGALISTMEREIATFASSHDLTFDPQDNLVKVRMGQLNQQFVDARGEEAVATTRYEEANALLTSTDKLSVGRVLTSPQLEQLRSEKARLDQLRAQLTGRFGKNHPLVMDADAELAANRTLIGDEAERIVQELANNSKVAATRTENLAAEVALLQKRVEGRNLAEIRRRELERDLLGEQKRYDQVVQRLGDLNPERGERKASAKVASYAEVPTSPSFPKSSLVLAAGLVGALILALVGVIIADALDDRLYRPLDVEEVLNRPNLITVPNLKRKLRGAQAPHRLVSDNPSSAFAKAMRNLCMAWETIDHAAGGKIIMVCSPSVGDGKTTMTLGLAAAAKAEGLRAVIIDFDPRENGAGRLLGVDSSDTALSKFLEGKADLKSVVSESSAYPFLHVVASRPNLRGIELLCSELRERYDLIIIDSPALQLEEDCVWLASQVDSIVMVVAAGRTKQRHLVDALNRLSVNHPVILGSVVNFFGKMPGNSRLAWS